MDMEGMAQDPDFRAACFGVAMFALLLSWSMLVDGLLE